METFNFNNAVLAVYKDGYRLAYSILSHQANSQDALHNAIEKAYKYQHKLKDVDKFKQWFLSIVVNEAKMLLRKDKDLVLWHTENEQQAQTITETDVANQVIIKECLSTLSTENRIMIVMKIILGYTHAEIAQILGKKESTVKTRIYRSLDKLNAYVKKGEEPYEHQSKTQTV